MASRCSLKDTLLVFADDWGRHPSSCQHLIRSLRSTYDVCWINTVGTRSPKLDLNTFSRGLEKLRQWVTPRKTDKHESTDDPRVFNPWMWPSFRAPPYRAMNRRLLRRQLSTIIDSMESPITAVTTLPIVVDLIGDLKIDRWVYYCVDDFTVWPGLDNEPLRRMEERLISRVDEIIAVSEALQSRIASLGRSSHLLTHGVDLQHWTRTNQRNEDLLARLPSGLERPWIVFWGVIDQRLDVQFLTRLLQDLRQGTVLLVGPENEPAPALPQSPRLVRSGALPYDFLPPLAAEAAVLIMPYGDMAVTRAMQPLKLKEYLATGKPVVASALPACKPWADCLDIAHDAAEFSMRVRDRLHRGLPEPQRAARGRLHSESWDAKAREFEGFLTCGGKASAFERPLAPDHRSFAAVPNPCVR
jgi:glycosyltransferase involved in cell wall biosynthesis